ncbi:MAG: MBL fold metallo-hydrolase [Sphingomonas sp.]
MRPLLHPLLVNGRFGDPAVLVRALHAPSLLLFDLGDLSPLSGRDLLRVDYVCVSHMHVDHFIGFDALLRVNVGRARTITVIGPEGIADAVGHKLKAYTWDLAERYQADLVFDVVELGAATGARRTRFRLRRRFEAEDGGAVALDGDKVADAGIFTIHAARVDHHGTSLAFAVAEPVHLNVWRNRVTARGLPLGDWLNRLKAAIREGRGDDHPIALPGAGEAPLGSLRDLVSVEAGQKLGYVADVRDTAANRKAIARLCADADVLIIEGAFAAADRDRADQRAHLTTRAAGEIARQARARRVEPFHFSPRYEGQQAMMIDEVERAFRSN